MTKSTRMTLGLLASLMFIAGCSSPTTPSPTDVAGRWVGQWARGACTDAGNLTGTCGILNVPNPLSLTLTQNGSSVSGTLALGAINFTVTGQVSGSSITISGQGTNSTGSQTLSAWSSSVSGTSMTGTFSMAVVSTGNAGTANISGTLQSVAKQ